MLEPTIELWAFTRAYSLRATHLEGLSCLRKRCLQIRIAERTSPFTQGQQGKCPGQASDF